MLQLNPQDSTVACSLLINAVDRLKQLQPREIYQDEKKNLLLVNVSA